VLVRILHWSVTIHNIQTILSRIPTSIAELNNFLFSDKRTIYEYVGTLHILLRNAFGNENVLSEDAIRKTTM
jgi:hypothetical protein